MRKDWHIRELYKRVTANGGLDGPGIESLCRRDFPRPSRPTLQPIQLPIQWVPDLFPRVKRPGCGVYYPPHSAEVKELVQLYIYSLSGASWPVLGWTLPVPLLQTQVLWTENSVGIRTLKYLVWGILCISEVIVSLFVCRKWGRRWRMQDWLQIGSFIEMNTSSCPLDVVNYSIPLRLSRECWRGRIFWD
jgi:hypothetical protein